ncbi:MAG: thiamine pyrophosphate-dependent dehydrogenase E1 component subunit alpha [Acidimicrobiia bacterium]|nr:thiamine pyrophosphate-dependent dehydrogenase E1 component subunit alpha [Acidimicrobiia bacterium]
MGELDRLAMYRQMVRIRQYESRIMQEYHSDKSPAWDIGAGLIPGEMHLAAGQEPAAVGVCAHLKKGDAITAPHRPHHFALAHGVDMNAMTAEIYGRTGGLCKGKGGHMHLFDPENHFSCSGIIAQGLPVACGQAMAFQRKGTDNVAIAVTGEGAANQGAFHESLNLAAVWNLPVIFVIEDNDWAISVPKDASTAGASNADRAAGYGMPGVRVEDNDVEAVFEAAGAAIDRARAGDGPSLIEIHTLRLFGHFEGDAQAYRPELDTVNDRDPIPKYAASLQELGELSNDQIASIQAEADAEVDAAIEFAKSSPEPAPEDALLHVFA